MMKYEYPNYKLKMEFTPGTWGENDWQLGETAANFMMMVMVTGTLERFAKSKM